MHFIICHIFTSKLLYSWVWLMSIMITVFIRADYTRTQKMVVMLDILRNVLRHVSYCRFTYFINTFSELLATSYGILVRMKWSIFKLTFVLTLAFLSYSSIVSFSSCTVCCMWISEMRCIKSKMVLSVVFKFVLAIQVKFVC